MKIKIGLVGHSFCSGNLGCGALGYGEAYCIKSIMEELELEYEIISFETLINNPYEPKDINIRLEEYNIKNIKRSAKQFSKCDLIIDITGGDSFSDIYGPKLFIVQMFIKIAVLLSKTKYINGPQTYGPYKRWWVRFFANLYVKKATRTFSRDQISKFSLSESNQDKVFECTDLGFLLPYEIHSKNKNKTVGINVSGLLYQSNQLLDKESSYKDIIDSLIQYFIKENYDIRLIPHVLGKELGADNDYYVSEKIAKKYNLEQPKYFSNPLEAKSYISGMDLFIGSRMHATIAAVSSAVPTIPLAYSKKFRGVFEAVNYNYTVEIYKDMNTDVVEQVKRYAESLNIIKKDLSISLEIINEKNNQYIQQLKEIIQEVAYDSNR